MQWHLVASSNKFTVYLSSYSVFLSAISGPMVCDYYLVRKGYLDVKHLYNARSDGPYYGHCGVSWRGYTAYICGLLINIVGFVGAVGVDVPQGATYIYNINYFSGFLVSGAAYYLLAWLFPIPATSDTWNEVPFEPEHMHLAEEKVVEQEIEDARVV